MHTSAHSMMAHHPRPVRLSGSSVSARRDVENTITSGGGVAKYSFPDKPVPTAEAEEILINRLINNNNKAMNFKKERNDENAGEHN